MDFTTILYNLILTIVTTATPILVGYLVIFIRQHLSTKQLETAKVISLNAVAYSNQISKELGLNNEQKLNSALASAQIIAEKYGIKLTSDQWKSLIEPCVNQLKQGLNDVLSVPNIDTQPIIQTEQFNSIQPILDEVPSIPEDIQTSEAPAIPVIEDIPEIVPETPITPEIQTPVEVIPTPVSVSPIVVSEDMMKEIYNQVLAKATADAEVAIKHVIENVQKSITPTV